MGLPIGSGIVEAANKTHIGERLKKSDMVWGMEGGRAVLRFRSLVKSNRFDQAWKWIVKEIDNRNLDNDNWKQYDVTIRLKNQCNYCMCMPQGVQENLHCSLNY